MRFVLFIAAFFVLSAMLIIVGCDDDEMIVGYGDDEDEASIDQFVGHWVNVDSGTGGITRVEIRVDVDTIFVHMWGKCHPKDCDWGEETTSISDADDGVLSLIWNQGFVIRNQTLSVLDSGLLKVETRSHFTDDSGRPDYDSMDQFSKE